MRTEGRWAELVDEGVHIGGLLTLHLSAGVSSELRKNQVNASISASFCWKRKVGTYFFVSFCEQNDGKRVILSKLPCSSPDEYNI